MKKKILIVNPFGIGDFLFSTPLALVLKKRDPRCYIGYICNIRTKEILETNPDIDEVFVFERDEYRALWRKSKILAIRKFFKFWHTIARVKFDKIIDLSLGREYAFFCWLIGIKKRRGFNYKGRGRFLTHKVLFEGFNDKPVADYYLNLIDFQTKRTILNMVLVSEDSDRKHIDSFLEKEEIKEQDLLVGIAPGGGASYGTEKADYKRWGCEKFALLSDKIISSGAKVILFGGPTEKKLIKDTTLKMRNRPIVAPEMKIREAACLIKRCKLIVCNDGGLLHIAVSQNISTVSIFGPTDDNVYGPYPASEKHIVLRSNVDCRPCYKRFKLPDCDTRKCLEDISVEEVFKAACFQLKEENR